MIEPYYKADGITIYHGDCREILLHIVGDVLVTDPPYGIDFAGQPTKWQRRAGKQAEDWDRQIVPEVPAIAARFGEAFVWGGNYYALPLTRGWLCWLKPDAPPSMGTFELCWTSRDAIARHVTRSISATNHERVGHPNQKPIPGHDVDAQLRIARRHRGPVHGQRHDAGRCQATRSAGHRHRDLRALLRDRGAAACTADARLRPGLPMTPILLILATFALGYGLLRAITSGLEHDQ